MFVGKKKNYLLENVQHAEVRFGFTQSPFVVIPRQRICPKSSQDQEKPIDLRMRTIQIHMVTPQGMRELYCKNKTKKPTKIISENKLIKEMSRPIRMREIF